MLIFEDENGFSQLENVGKLPLGAKLYELSFPTDMNIQCQVVFPQFELRIISSGNSGYNSKWEIIYKRDIHFSPSVSNPYLYVINLLNDLKKHNYEKKILEYIKAEVANENYLEIKRKIDHLNDFEELQQSNIKLTASLNEILEIKNDIHRIKDEILIIQKHINSSFKDKLTRWLRFLTKWNIC